MRYLLCCFLLCATVFAARAQPYERYRHLTDTTLGPGTLPYAKRLHLTVPLEYNAADTSRRFPLIILFDAQNKRSYQHILRSIDYLTANEQMPGVVIAGIESEQSRRYGETQLEQADSSSWGRLHGRFVMDELVALMRQRYLASDFLIIIGHSRTAFFATWLLCHYPQRVQGVVANSPFFAQPGVQLTDSLAQLLQRLAPGRHLYYRFAIGNDYPEEYAKADSVLRRHGAGSGAWQFAGQWHPQADHNVTPGLHSMQALYQIFEPWAQQQQRYMADSAAALQVKPYEQTLRQHYGAALPMALGILNGKGWHHYNRNEYRQAAAAWQHLVDSYPSFSEGYLGLMEALKASGAPYKQWLAPLRRSLPNNAFYTAEEIKELEEEMKKLEQEK